MTPSEAEAILAEVSYRPGYFFQMAPMLDGAGRSLGHAIIIWQLDRPDSHDPTRRLNLRYTGQVIGHESLDLWKIEDLLRRVREEAMRLEVHETSEWLRYQGRQFMDPHDRKGERMLEYALDGALFDVSAVDGVR